MFDSMGLNFGPTSIGTWCRFTPGYCMFPREGDGKRMQEEGERLKDDREWKKRSIDA